MESLRLGKSKEDNEKMNKLIKVIGVLALVLVVAASAVLIAAKFLITPERVRQVVIPMAEEQLNRPVSIGEIQVRIFSGIVISDFAIGSKNDTKNFVSAESLVLRYRFWPLFRLSVVVDEIRLDSPEIRVERYENGKFNFSDLMAQKTDVPDIIPESQDVRVDDTDGGRPIDLLINELSISNGMLFFMDHMVKQEYRLTDLSLSVSDFSRVRSFPFDFSANINNAPLEVGGTINPETMHITAGIVLNDLDMAAFMPYVAEDIPGKISRLKLSMDLKADATGQTVDSYGRITLNDIDLLLDDMPDVPVEIARVTLDVDIGLDLVSEKLTITKADGDINGILLSASGSVLSYGKDPVLDITAKMPMISLSDLIASLPQKWVEPVAKMRPEGHVGAQFHVNGSPDKPKELIKKGEITLDKILVTINQLIPEITGDIRLTKDNAASDNLMINLAGDRLRMDFTANNLMEKVISINNTITADKLNIDRLLASMGVDKEDPVHPPDKPTDRRTQAKRQEPGPFDIPAQVKGGVRVANAIFRGMAVTNFDLQYLLKDNVLTVNHLRGNVAGGKISGTARAELNRKPIAYTANISVEETRAENIMNALFPRASNTIFGNMFLKSDIQGEGTTWDIIRQKLTSRSDVNVTDGRLTGTGLAGGLAGFLNTRRLEVLEFDSLKGNMKLEKGNIKLDSRFTGNEVRMAPTGTIGLDGSLNLSLNMRLAPAIASQVQIGKLYSQLAQTSDGWTMVPLGVAGTLQSPKFSVDTSAVSDQLMERGKEELRKQLQDKVLERLTPQSQDNNAKEPDKEEKATPEKILEDTLRRLFN
jgi:AsmA protein